MLSKDQMRVYMRNYRAQKRKQARDFLGGVCVKCGTVEHLEFDHIDRRTKTEYIANLLTSSKKVFAKELNKCQLLCKKCHILKSRPEVSLLFSKPMQHGTVYAYQKHKCRCDLCKKAMQVRSKTWPSKQNKSGPDRGNCTP